MKVYFAGIMVTDVMSNKPDGKERGVKEERTCSRTNGGRFLSSRRQNKSGRCLTVILLLAWDGLLLYMIVECLIDPVYGAAFAAVISVYLGMKL